MSARYYVLFIWQDVEPEIHGPYDTEDERDGMALILRQRDTDDLKSGIFPVEIDEDGALQVDSYSGGFFTEELDLEGGAP